MFERGSANDALTSLNTVYFYIGYVFQMNKCLQVEENGPTIVPDSNPKYSTVSQIFVKIFTLLVAVLTWY